MDIALLSSIFVLTKDAIEILNKVGVDTSQGLKGKKPDEEINLQELSTILIKEGKPLNEIILILDEKRNFILKEISELSRKIIEINSQVGDINKGIDALKSLNEEKGRYPEFIPWIDQHMLELSNRAYDASFSQSERYKHQQEQKEAYIWCLTACIGLARDKLFSEKAPDGPILSIKRISDRVKFSRSAYTKAIELIVREADKNGSKIAVKEFKKHLENIMQRIS